MTDAPWPFVDPPNTATITHELVLSGEKPVGFVSHDAEDGMWQFLPIMEQIKEEDARVVALSHVLSLDPSLSVISDLKLGWEATREGGDGDWIRTKSRS